MKKGRVVVDARKKIFEKVQSYLSEKLSSGLNIVKVLPDFIKTKKFDYTFRNGVLEVRFKK